MSEKRFTLNMMKKPSEIEMDGKMISKYDVVRLLNEQQDTITAQKKGLDEYMDNIIALSKENEQLKHYKLYEDNKRLQTIIADLKKENEQLQKKITPSIYNKKDGNWKWNVDNNTILNIKTGEIFYLRNSGAVENLVGSLNTLHQENQELKKKNNALKEDINQSEKRVKHWMMLYGDVYDKMQKRRVSG